MCIRDRPRTVALQIKPEQDQSYVEVLAELRKKAKAEDSETEIQSIRQSRSNVVLLACLAGRQG